MQTKNIIRLMIAITYGSMVYANPAPEINCITNPPNSLNWSNCDKQNRNIANQELDFGIFHSTNFQNSNLFKSNLNYSDLTGANLIGSNLDLVSLNYTIWIDGRMCKLGSIKICNKMSLDETYKKLYELYNEALNGDPYDNHGFARYFRIVAQHSINEVLPNFISRFSDVVKHHPEINNEDPISYDEFKENEEIIILEYDNQKMVAFKIASFYDYINNQNFRIKNPVGGMLKLRKD